MKKPITEREQIVSAFVKREIGKDTAASLLGCTKRTLATHVRAYLTYGVSGLIDHRKAIIVNYQFPRLKQSSYSNGKSLGDQLETSGTI